MESFELGPPEGEHAVLLLHGFSGSPFEVRPLAEALATKGYRVAAPLLPGHGTDVGRLGSVGEADWLAAAHDALDALRARHRTVFLAGFSAGGALSIRLAADRPREIAALALLAPALGFHGNARLYRELFRFRALSRFWPAVSKGDPDLSDPHLRAQMPRVREIPTIAAHALDRLVHGARMSLPLVRAPAIVLWGARDAVVPRWAAEEAAERIGSGPTRLTIFRSSAHQLALDVERAAVAAEVVGFFENRKE